MTFLPWLVVGETWDWTFKPMVSAKHRSVGHSSNRQQRGFQYHSASEKKQNSNLISYLSCWHKKIIEEAALFSSVLRSFEEIPPFPPYPLPSHILECWTPLKLFPAFWTTLVSEEPRAAGLAGLAGLAGPGLRVAQWWEGQDGEGCETWGILRCLALCLWAQRTGRKGTHGSKHRRSLQVTGYRSKFGEE